MAVNNESTNQPIRDEKKHRGNIVSIKIHSQSCTVYNSDSILLLENLISLLPKHLFIVQVIHFPCWPHIFRFYLDSRTIWGLDRGHNNPETSEFLACALTTEVPLS